jgi:hypothetical protein
VETLVVIVVAVWAIRRLIVDGAFALRGQVPPTMARRQAAGRYGVRGYFGDVWSDAWQAANQRRLDRRQARAQRRETGELGRLGKLRWAWRSAGGSRHLHRRADGTLVDTTNPTRWDEAWSRYEDRRAARSARRAARERERADAGPDRMPPQVGPGADRSPAEPDAAPGRLAQTGPEPAHRPETGPQPAHRPEPGGDPDAGPEGHPDGVAEPATPRQPPRHDNEHSEHGKGDGQMVEATGLDSAIRYADAQRQANEDNIAEIESWIASLQANEVSGEALEAARRAEEQQQLAAASWQQAQAALESHRQVQEAYAATGNQAGSKQFVTSE